VAQVLAHEGQVVESGAVIARLETSAALAAEVARAEMEVLNARQAVRDLESSAGSERAAAGLAEVEAQEALAQAQRKLHALENPNRAYYANLVETAERALTVAEQNVVITDLGGLSAALAAARQTLADAEGTVQTLQALETQYPGGFGDRLAKAQQARARAADNVQVLELQVDQAQQSSALGVANAQEALDRARANLAGAEAGPNPADLALAQAKKRVDVAEAALAAAQAAFDGSALRAPFDGTLASLDVQPGQPVGGGQAVATLADLTGWLLETGNLTEVEVVSVQPGQDVALVFDALPEASLRGTVLAVRDVYTDVRGDVTYTVRITLTEGHPALRWGMTAQVTFQP
jgi:HlyD family secretion protein